jgi:hypothetical protein
LIFFLTYNDQPSGVYWSQVTDVVAHLNTLGGPRVRLLALVSARDYWGIRRKIRSHSPDALVFPMVPTMKRWRSNAGLVKQICRWWKPSGLIARGVLATWMALRAREAGLVDHVCFDARGAYAAEWEEYRIIDDDALIQQFRAVEAEAVAKSDMRIAVSEALVAHWRERYGYADEAHAVVPCTLGTVHITAVGSDADAQRGEFGFGPMDVVLAYAGSTAGWQSFALLENIIGQVLAAQPNVKVLFLCAPDPAIDALVANWLGRALRTWVKPAEVPSVLAACDVALLLREESLTNRVASPTKFAEYLASGLPVAISAHIGDFSALVERDRLGVVLHGDQPLPMLYRPEPALRANLRRYALDHFTKAAYNTAYLRILSALG